MKIIYDEDSFNITVVSLQLEDWSQDNIASLVNYFNSNHLRGRLTATNKLFYCADDHPAVSNFIEIIIASNEGNSCDIYSE